MVLTFSNDRSAGAGKLAWVFGHASGVADAVYAYNSTGSTNTVTRLSLGVYAVDLPGTNLQRGTAHVTALGLRSDDGGYCNLGNWQLRRPASRFVVEVRCFDAAGQLSDHDFLFSYADNVSLLGDGPTRVSYAFMSDGFAVTPRLGEATHQFNSAGRTDTPDRAGSPRGMPNWVGVYSLTTRGLLAPPLVPSAYPVPMAVAYGSNAHCRPVVYSAYRPDSPDELALVTHVFCTQPGGSETDSAHVSQLVGR